MSKQGDFFIKELPNLLDVGQRSNLRIQLKNRMHFSLHHKGNEYKFYISVPSYIDAGKKLDMKAMSRADLLKYLAENGYTFRLVGFKRDVSYIHIGKTK